MHRVLLALGFVLTLAPGASAAKLRVPKDHATIQAAIDAAGPGDVVEISKGTYQETLSISKSDVTVRAKKGHVVVVDAGGTGRPLGVLFSVGVTVKNLRFRNTADDVGIGVAVSSGIVLRGCRVEDVPNHHGIEIGAATVTLEKCRVDGVGGDGIHVTTNDAVIRKCTVREVGGAGVAVLGARVTIERNTIEGAGGGGIVVGNGVTGSTDAVVKKNDVTANVGPGISVASDATGGLYTKNTVKKGLADGLLVAGIGNSFVGNTAKKNGGFDLNDSTGEGENTYSGNSFGTVN